MPVITRVSHFASTFQTRPSPSGPSAFLFRLMPFPVEDMFPNSHRRTTPSPDAFPNHISPGNQRAAGAIPPPSPCHSTPFSPRGGVPPNGARTKSAVMMCCGTTHAEKYKRRIIGGIKQPEREEEEEEGGLVPTTHAPRERGGIADIFRIPADEHVRLHRPHAAPAAFPRVPS